MHNVHKVIDEVSANALGVFLLSIKGVRTVSNIGGQDIKVNDKFAAGTGRFFEMAPPVH
ncbi:MAG: hypothetical protein J7K75_11610 [Desulfuromonas sp.]|nr:hypothetical protein [Desulfuromonas sp.]